LEATAATCISLVDVKAEVRGMIQVLYAGRDVSNISKCRYEVRNIGNEPIRPDEIVVMPYLLLPKEMGVLECRISDQDPGDLGASLSYDTTSGKCELNLSLLNPGDNFAVEIIYTGTVGDLPPLQGRISGIRHIATVSRPVERPKHAEWKLIFLKIVASVSAAVVFLLGASGVVSGGQDAVFMGKRYREARRVQRLVRGVMPQAEIASLLRANPGAVNRVEIEFLRTVFDGELKFDGPTWYLTYGIGPLSTFRAVPPLKPNLGEAVLERLTDAIRQGVRDDLMKLRPAATKARLLTALASVIVASGMFLAWAVWFW
jgi:hypothetical protein